MVYIFLYERQGHKIKLEGTTFTKQKEPLLRAAHSYDLLQDVGGVQILHEVKKGFIHGH